MQTVWKGSISFGLVSIPVRLVSATEERDVSFRQVHAVDGGRIRYRRVCEADGREVAYAEIAKGYELPDGDMVILDDADLAELPIASARAVDVLAFVPFSQIDPTALAKSYYAEPTGDAKPYVLLRDALEQSDRVAVVKVALRQRERLALLRPREGVLVVQTMLWPDEVRQADFAFLHDDVRVRPQEMQMASSYVEAMADGFQPSEYVDDYRRALEEVVQAKVNGREVTRPPRSSAEEGKVVDLMEALRRSVDEARQRRGGEDASAEADAGGANARSAKAVKSAKHAQATPGAAVKAAKTASSGKKSTAKKSTARPASRKQPGKESSKASGEAAGAAASKQSAASGRRRSA